jgi:hypothetical protein
MSSKLLPAFIPTCRRSIRAERTKRVFHGENDYTRLRPDYFNAADERLAFLVESGFTPCIVGAWGYFIKFMGVEKAGFIGAISLRVTEPGLLSGASRAKRTCRTISRKDFL